MCVCEGNRFDLICQCEWEQLNLMSVNEISLTCSLLVCVECGQLDFSACVNGISLLVC